MNFKHLAATAALLATLGSAAHAQMTMPTPSALLTSTDRDFLMKDAQGSVGDMGHGQAGVQLASNNNLRQFAIQIVEDHNRLNMGLYQLAGKKGIALPVVMEDKDRSELKDLVKKSGTDFDRAFLEQEVRINTQDVKDADQELSTTTDPDIRSLVMEYRNTEAFMLARAQGFLTQMQGK